MNPCIDCGACCAFFRVSFYWAEAGDEPGRVPSEFVHPLPPHRSCMAGTDAIRPRCVCLGGTIGRTVRCSIYAVRPTPCRDFEASWVQGRHNPDCDRARAAHGMPPLERDPGRSPEITDPEQPRRSA